jgi:hypothetical protein
MSETSEAPTTTPVVESPPLAPQPARESIDDPRLALHRLATELIRTRNRRLLVEFLTLRRAMR